MWQIKRPDELNNVELDEFYHTRNLYSVSSPICQSSSLRLDLQILQHHFKSFNSKSSCLKSESFARFNYHLGATNSENTKCILISLLPESQKRNKN